MIPPEVVAKLERAVHEALADWPAQWTGFHWPGYTLQHTARVRRLSVRLAAEEGADVAVVDAAALLHDICKAEGKVHAERGAERARELLDGDLPSAVVERIAATIAAHNSAVEGDPVEWRVLSDADKIDANFGLVAVARYFTIRGSRGEALEACLADIPGWHERHLTILGWLATAAGRRLADERLAAMQGFCAAVAEGGVAREVAEFFLHDSVRPDLSRQVARLAAGERTRRLAVRLRREMDAEV